MDRSITDSINLWLSIIIAGIILNIWAISGSVSREYSRYQQSELDAIAVVKEYREWNVYDNTQVYAQDIATAILKYRGKPEVFVDTDLTVAVVWGLKWDMATAPTQYTATIISGQLPVNAIYISTIVKDANGSVIRLEFRR